MSRTITEYIADAHETAKSKGWWDIREGEAQRGFPEQIALMHSELSEALEYYRMYGMRPTVAMEDPFGHIIVTPGYLFYQTKDGDSVSEPVFYHEEDGEILNKPEGIAAELADVLVRIFDTCGRYEIPLVQALDEKMAYNKTRAFKHGGKLC